METGHEQNYRLRGTVDKMILVLESESPNALPFPSTKGISNHFTLRQVTILITELSCRLCVCLCVSVWGNCLCAPCQLSNRNRNSGKIGFHVLDSWAE